MYKRATTVWMYPRKGVLVLDSKIVTLAGTLEPDLDHLLLIIFLSKTSSKSWKRSRVLLRMCKIKQPLRKIMEELPLPILKLVSQDQSASIVFTLPVPRHPLGRINKSFFKHKKRIYSQKPTIIVLEALTQMEVVITHLQARVWCKRKLYL